MYNFGKIKCTFILVLYFITFWGCSLDGEEICTCFDSNTIPIDEKIIWNGTINDDFDDSSIVVIMDGNFSRINLPPKKCFFGDIKIEYIWDLTTITGNFETIDLEIWRQILEVKLPVNSKENVVYVIRHIENIDGVKYVGPNHYSYPAGL